MNANAQHLARLPRRRVGAHVDRTGRVQTDVITVQRFGKSYGFTRGQRMLRQHHHHQFVLAVQHAVQALDVTVVGTNTEIRDAIEHALNHPGTGPFFKVSLDLRMPRGKVA